MTDTMKLWDAVQTTHAEHTKHVNQRGGFTSIDAHYQVREATRQFGPVGVGWGYENGDPIFHDKFVIVPVTLWHGTRENTFGPIYGCAEMLGNRPDSDAPKKASTDGLTKALSHLGFSADVFLGMWDDNKYVKERKAEAEQRQREAAKKPEATSADKADWLIANIRKADSIPRIEAWLAEPARLNVFNALDDQDKARVAAEKETKFAELGEIVDAA